MRLLQLKPNGEFGLTENLYNNIPPYAILSHTWGNDDQEVTLRDLTEGSGKTKDGYRKIQFCAEQAAHDKLRYFWIDTCCIDKLSSADLSEAITSMFRWYCNAAECYVYLSDVSTNDHNQTDPPLQSCESAFRKSRWFTRGWTLQELIAPSSVKFFSLEGNLLGDKRSLEQPIHEITKIAVPALQGTPLSQFDVDERFSWAQNRQTKRKEDEAYSLLGIFGVFLPPMYGEADNAFKRLREGIKANTIIEDNLVDLGLRKVKTKINNTASVVQAITTLSSGRPLDDKELLLENGIAMLQSLPPNSSLSSTVSGDLIGMLWDELPHPPRTTVGPTARHRQHDGSGNNPWNPEMGKAGSPYSRSVPPLKPKGPYLPDPELVFEQLLKRTEGMFREHPAGLNRLFFSFSTMVIHECF
jgi:hypothetical protein